MFRKLKIKLTIINLSTVLLILTFIFAGIYVSFSRNLSMQADNMMTELLKLGNVGQISNLPDITNEFGHRNAPVLFNYVLVKVDKEGKVLEVSRNNDLSTKELDRIVGETIKNSSLKGSITMNFGTFRYMEIKNSEGSILGFYNENMGKTFLKILLISFIVIGAICIFLAFLSSYFLASKALVPVKEAWQKEKDFVADASHELRTPLAVIRTNMEIVMDNPNETVKSQANWIDNINFEYNKMSKLVDDLLFLAREDAKEQEIDISAFNLSETVFQASNTFKPLAAEKSIELIVEVEKGIVISGDEIKMNRLLCILIDNAIKYTQSKGRIEITCSRRDKHSIVSVSDTGIGISIEDIDKIFQRFYRVDKSRNSENEGTGLGLSIGSSIIKHFKGTLKVSSVLGKGSIFEVEI